MEKTGRRAATIVRVASFGEHYQTVYFSDFTVIVYDPMHGAVVAASRLPESFEEALGRVAAEAVAEGG